MRTFCLYIFLFFSANAIACKCDTTSFTLEGIKRYELIFAGEVTSVSICEQKPKATFTVKELYRGKCFDTVSVEFDCSSSCAMSFSPGETWIIFATYEKYGKPEVELCSHSRRKFADEKDDFYFQLSGISFGDAQAFLKKNLGTQPFSIKTAEEDQHHENIRPKGYEALWYLIAGFVVLFLFYFLGNKFLK
jgi:hypothetical protein